MGVMKNTGVAWIGEIPSEWELGKVKYGFDRKKEKSTEKDPVVLSLARAGVKVRDISTNEGQLAASYEGYNPVEPNDLLLNPMDLISGANCSISHVSGVISPAYMNLRARNGFDPRYYDYYFKTQYWSLALFAHGKGVSFDNRWTLNESTLRDYFIPLPSYQEQQAIADYLDDRCSKIDEIISEATVSIEEYKELKQAMIFEAVTKGLDKNVQMRDSGIQEIGDIPLDWSVIKLKYVLTISSGDAIRAEELNPEGAYPVFGGGEQIGFCDGFNCDENNLLIGRVGARCGCVTRPSVSSWATDNALIISTHINRDYLYYVLDAAQLNNLNTSNAQPLITGSKIKNKRVAFTYDQKEQKNIVMYLEKKVAEIDALISEKQALVNDLQAYKKSLIYEVVTGKKRVIV